MFHPGLISDNGVFGFTLSPDGNEAFWVKSNGGRDTLFILQSVKVKGTWTKPKPASFSSTSTSWKDIDPVFSPDGNTILFQSTRPVEGLPDREGFDIWGVKRTADGWGDPYHLGNVINSDVSESYASIANNGNIYFMKENPDGKGSSDIYVSRFRNGAYQLPENIGNPINTSFRESNPFISPDEDYLIYFSSDSTGHGEVDLYIAHRANGTWSKPVNLGKPINSEVGEFCPFFHKREKRLYFSRTVKTANNRRIENIYSVSFEVKAK
jgi:Tol biopolymer transport system component